MHRKKLTTLYLEKKKIKIKWRSPLQLQGGSRHFKKTGKQPKPPTILISFFFSLINHRIIRHPKKTNSVRLLCVVLEKKRKMKISIPCAYCFWGEGVLCVCVYTLQQEQINVHGCGVWGGTICVFSVVCVCVLMLMVEKEDS